MILAGDIGGTKCNLALFEGEPGSLRRVAYRRFASKDYPQLGDLVNEFAREVGIGGSGTVSGKITAAGFGVAGPVIDQRVQATNLPWLVDGASLARQLGIERVVLLNDLEATGYSIAHLSASEVCVLNDGKSEPQANQALIAAGTGLGEAILFWDGSRHVVTATEGGHTDLAPRTEQEIELLRFLKKREEHVSWEIVLSGRGFQAIHEFLDPAVKHPGFDVPDVDPAPEITRRALAGSCPVCISALDIWTALYGAEAGNLALKTLARGGVYVAGGIAVKVLPKMKDGTFVRAFCEKEKFRILLSQIPIHVVLNEEAPLWGAAAQAALTPGA